MADKIGYLIDANGDFILDENGNKIPKDTRDVRNFPRSDMKPEEFEAFLPRMRSEVLRRSGFKIDANGNPVLTEDGTPVLLTDERVDFFGNPLLGENGKPIPLGLGHISGPIIDRDTDTYNPNEFDYHADRVAEGKKVLTEDGNQLLDRLIYICELFNKRLTKFPEAYDNIPKGFDTPTIDSMLSSLERESMLDSRSSCRSWCTGLCVSSCGAQCSDLCYATCMGCSQECKSMCARTCGDSCRNDCTIECFSTCQEVCITECLGSCKTTCKGACVTNCYGACTGTCSDGCSSCTGTCKGSCSGACVSCSGSCSGNGCKTTCNTQCTQGCNTGCKENCDSSSASSESTETS